MRSKVKPDKKTNVRRQIQLLESVFTQAIAKITQDLFSYTDHTLCLSSQEQQVLHKGFTLFKDKYIFALDKALELARFAAMDTRCNKARISYFNPIMQQYKHDTLCHFPPAANAWILDGIVIERQIGGLKKLAGLSTDEGAVLDVLGSASSLSLGAENPWLIQADQIEDYLGIKDNLATLYHPGIRHAFALEHLAQLYPGRKTSKDIHVHIESSGTIANAIAIESVCAYMEHQGIANGKVLAIDGTWAGGYGTAREATGFNLTQQMLKRAKETIWVDRCLPSPTQAHRNLFLTLLQQKLALEKVAGILMEPDVLGDLGIILVDQSLLQEIVDICKQRRIPIILDCVQQLGRSGSYWGENVELFFHDVPLLIVTTAKSAANGQPLALTLMPKEIAQAAYPLTQITTNQMNGPLLRALVAAEVLRNPQLQAWFLEKGKQIEEIAASYDIPLGEKGLRGKFLNRGVYVGNNGNVKLAQIALLVEDGVLVGALPEAIRYQPMLLEFSETNQLVAHIIFRRIKKVLEGDISKDILHIYRKMENLSSGLAR